MLDIGSEHKVDAAADRIGPFVSNLLHHIASVIHHIAIVARPTAHRVRARPTIQRVRLRVACDAVGQCVPGPQQCAAGEDQVVHLGPQGVVDAAVDGVRTLSGGFGDHIPRVVHHVGVVARTTGHRVRASRAIERVGLRVAGQDIVQRVAGA